MKVRGALIVAAFLMGLILRFLIVPGETESETAEAQQKPQLAEPNSQDSPAAIPSSRRSVSLQAINEASGSRKLFLLADALPSLTLEELPEILDNMNGYIVFLRWLELDPESALARARENPGSELGPCLLVWTAMDFDTAIAGMRSKEYARYVRHFSGNLKSKDTGRAVDLFIEHPHFYQTDMIQLVSENQPDRLYELAEKTTGWDLSYSSPVFGAWAEHDPAAASTWIQNHVKSLGKRQKLLEIVYREKMRQDPESALAFFEDLPPGSVKTGLAPDSARLLAKRDPEEAFAWAESLASNRARQAACQALIEDRLENDLPGAVSLMARAGLRSGGASWEAIGEPLENGLKALAVSDVPQALQLYGQLDPEDLRAPLVDQLTQEKKPAELASLALELSSQELGTMTMGLAVTRWAEEDREAAKEFVLSLEDPGHLEIGHSKIVSSLTYNDGIRWIDEAPESIRNALFTHAFGELTKTNRDEAHEISHTLVDPDRRTAAALELFNQVWHDPDVSRFPSLLEDLPESEIVKRAEHLTSSWMKQDPHGASQWAASLEPGKLKDGVVRKLVRGLGVGVSRVNTATDDFERALSWSQALENRADQLDLARLVLRWWKVYEPRAAVKALDTLDLNDVERQNLQTVLEK
ncbi:MAG: hypothetical protein AAF514_17965 [Verrucomicrobiota bacterium]